MEKTQKSDSKSSNISKIIKNLKSVACAIDFQIFKGFRLEIL